MSAASRTEITIVFNLITETRSHYSCCILWMRSQSFGSAHTQEAGITRGCGRQEAAIFEVCQSHTCTSQRWSQLPWTTRMESGGNNTPYPQGVLGCFCYFFSRRRENGSEMDKRQRPLTKQLKEFVVNTIIYLLVSRRMYYFPEWKMSGLPHSHQHWALLGVSPPASTFASLKVYKNDF